MTKFNSPVSEVVIIDEDERDLVNSNVNLQYSLTLIEASIEYLTFLNTEDVNDKNSTIRLLKKIISLTFIKDEINKLFYSKEMLKQLLKDHERIIGQLRSSFEKYKDKEEATFIDSIIEKHQSIAKRLRKYF